jgi:hypothetical protein
MFSLRKMALFWITLGILVLIAQGLGAQSLDIPSRRWGISFGNSKQFTGLRFNFQDSRVRRINGVNITLWVPKKDNTEAVVNGVSFGLIPAGAHMRGIQIGILGAGANASMTGINLGLLGVGAGEDLTGINLGGLGAGAGKNMTGINLGLFGAGAGEDVKGINIGGLGVGAGKDMTGFNVGGLGVGAGECLTGISIGGLGVGAGERLAGLTVAGLGAGAPEVHGLTVGGLGVGGESIKGVHLALGMVRVEDDGQMVGLAISAVNIIKGIQKGLSIGIVNYAWRLKGVQIGLINIVRDGAAIARVLPIINVNF